MSQDSPHSTLEIEPRSSRDITPYLSRQLERQCHTRHEHAVVPDLPNAPWRSYSSQVHVRRMAFDRARGILWLATWGGVLCWQPAADLCIRHTSVHGMLGNATRELVVDMTGVVWVAGQDWGLVSLLPAASSRWQAHPDFRSWKVLRLAARPEEGILVALRDQGGRCVVGEVISPEAGLEVLIDGGLESKDIETLLVTDDLLWLGNAWGLHRYNLSRHELQGFAVEGLRLRSLVPDAIAGLWLGAHDGPYRFHPERGSSPIQQDGWPRDEVTSLEIEPESGIVWVATARQLGRIVNDVWQPARRNLPRRATCLVVTDLAPEAFATRLHQGSLLAGTSDGLYSVGAAAYAKALSPSDEDGLSNGVQCLRSDAENLWLGSTGGLFRFDGQRWHSYADGGSRLSLIDVRSISPESSDGQMWLGTGHGAICRFLNRNYIEEQYLSAPVVSIVGRVAATLWAATVDAVYCLDSRTGECRLVLRLPQSPSGIGIIQAMLYHGEEEAGGPAGSSLWIGTSSGLFCYQPDKDLGDWVSGELGRLSIQALAMDPTNNRLWVGTREGLFSMPDRYCYYSADVHAITFTALPLPAIWLGTAQGLERWSIPSDASSFAGSPSARFLTSDSGLAGDRVTALAARRAGATEEIWIGSTAGVSCYHLPAVTM